MFKELHKSGFLQPKLGKGRWERKVFDKLHLDSFLEMVFNEVPILDKIPEGAVLLDLSTRSANCSVSDILNLIVNGYLRPAGRLGKARHLKNLLVNTNELLTAFPQRVSNGYTKTEACKILHVDTRSLNHLISVELLKTRRMKSSITRVTNDLILPQSIEAFQNTYCSLGMLRQSDPELSGIRHIDLDEMDIVPFVDIKGLRRIYRLVDLPCDLAIELNGVRGEETAPENLRINK